jgi:predicted phosphohydrolase
MKILFLSDTHGLHRHLGPLPEADILVHAGDVTRQGTEGELDDFVSWLGALPYACKVFVAGNHDDCLYGRTTLEGLPAGVHYLCNTSLRVGGLLFYGLPLFRPDEASGEYDCQIDAIPADTDVLVTHQPPLGILDGAVEGGRKISFGNAHLCQRVEAVRPRVHLFGHNHNDYGQRRVGSTLFVNAALVNHDYQLCRQPLIVTVPDEGSSAVSR